MRYTIYTDDVYKIYENGVYSVEAESPKEAIELFKRGDAYWVDSINQDYGNCLESDFAWIEDENGNDVTNQIEE